MKTEERREGGREGSEVKRGRMNRFGLPVCK